MIALQLMSQQRMQTGAGVKAAIFPDDSVIEDWVFEYMANDTYYGLSQSTTISKWFPLCGSDAAMKTEI